MAMLAVLPKREFDYRNVLKALPVVHKYSLHVLLKEMDGLSEVEKWLLLHEADLTIIKPALLGAMKATDDYWLWSFNDVEGREYRQEVVRLAELGESLNMPELKAICFNWLEENLENHLNVGVEDEEKATTITRWLKLVEQPTFASLKPICTSWLASNIEACLTEQNVYSWVKRADDNQWDGVLAAALTWLAESSNCEDLAQLLDSTPLISLLESLETPCALSSPFLEQLLQTSSVVAPFGAAAAAGGKTHSCVLLCTQDKDTSV
eukprot:gene23887-9453_t